MAPAKRQQPGWVIPNIFGLLILVISSAQCESFHLEMGPWLSHRTAEQLEPGSWCVEHHSLTVPGWAGEHDNLWGVSDGGGCSVCWCWCQTTAQRGTYLGEHPSWLPDTHPLSQLQETEPCLSPAPSPLARARKAHNPSWAQASLQTGVGGSPAWVSFIQTCHTAGSELPPSPDSACLLPAESCCTFLQ